VPSIASFPCSMDQLHPQDKEVKKTTSGGSIGSLLKVGL
jgi:hypothetical protein